MEPSDARLPQLLFAALCLTAMASNAEQPVRYRNGLPAVTMPEAADISPTPGTGSARFAVWYEQKGRPRFVVYWERELTADVDRPTHDALHVHDKPVASGSLTTIVIEKGKDAPKTQRRPLIAEREAWQIESAFTDTMVAAGARFVDRNTAIRLQNLTDREAREQTLEMTALSESADVLCEILPTYDHDGLLGLGFRLTCKDVRTGGVLANTYSLGGSSRRLTERPTVSGWRAPDNAVRASERPLLVGRRLATDLMAALGTSRP